MIRNNKKQCLNLKKEVHNKLTNLESSILLNVIRLVDCYATIRIDEHIMHMKG